ncbi:MAG: tryptophan 7-halogenase [Phycisphaeraceae bacterium]|nr:tryptophan 7-halogenase [Phycisphaeraceae bacterium]
MISARVDAYDVVVIGGGPAGTTVASLLRKYNPNLSVLILEKEKFPREHIGESQLPGISGILHEMGVWDKVEAANFPIKIGASYTWGKIGDIWDFDFYPAEEFVDEARPAKFEGQRRFTAFQVERAIYDEILLRHAETLGAMVREETQVRDVLHEGDRITGLRLDSGEVVTARWYVDASGHVGLIRRAMGVENQVPPDLMNIAVWDYYDNAEWKVKIGVGGTRVQVRSLPYGWIWFIPMGLTKSSVGLVCPSTYYKQSGLTPKELLHKALAEQSEIAALLKNAVSTTGEEIRTTKNWSNLSERLAGENWWLCGESAGFADPILAAGMTLAHTSARDVAYSILEMERGELDQKWLRTRYDEKNRLNIQQHIRFAQYWYAANTCFTDLQAHCTQIAKDAGFKLKPSEAWRWLAQGGFATEFVDRAGFGSFDLGASKQVMERFSGVAAEFEFGKYNQYKLNLIGAKETCLGDLKDGRIHRVKCLQKGVHILPAVGYYQAMVDILKKHADVKNILHAVEARCALVPQGGRASEIFAHFQALEAMLLDGWVTGKLNPKKPTLNLSQSGGGRLIRSNDEGTKALEKARQKRGA